MMVAVLIMILLVSMEVFVMTVQVNKESDCEVLEASSSFSTPFFFKK